MENNLKIYFLNQTFSCRKFFALYDALHKKQAFTDLLLLFLWDSPVVSAKTISKNNKFFFQEK